jgi:hypothetical protein
LGRRAAYLGLLLGGVFLPLALPVLAASTDTVQTTSPAAPALMLAKN